MPAWINLRIKAFGTCAFTMLTIILMIGPLARLDRRFLPLLYNRRHFGVLTFLVALVHAYSVVDWFAVQGVMDDLIGEMTGSPNYGKFIGFPIKALGLTGLTILFLLAATSHDFWLAFLTPRVWKALHMALYLAYGVLVMHVALGVMQEDRRAFIPLLLGGSFAAVTLLHLAAAWRERETAQAGEWLAVGPPEDDPRPVRAHRGGAERRAHRGVPRRPPDRRADQCLRAPERADRRRPHHQWLRHLPVARLRVPAGGRLRAAALHREARDLPAAHPRRHRRGRSERAAAGHAGGDHVAGKANSE